VPTAARRRRKRSGWVPARLGSGCADPRPRRAGR
jgi:hypothetical protein